MVGQQAQVIVEQGLQATLLHAGNARVLTLPEIAVVHQHQVGIGFNRRIQQRLAGSDAADDASNLRPPFYLQAIRAVILDFCAAKVAFGFLDQGAQGNSHEKTPQFSSSARRKAPYNDRHYGPSPGLGKPTAVAWGPARCSNGSSRFNSSCTASAAV
ncbi:hypothetical protein D3C72_1452270 [compost metagenome]